MEAGSSRGFNPRSRPAPMMRPTPGPMPGRPGMGLGGRRGETPTDDAGMGTTPIEDTHAGMAAAAVFGPQLAPDAISGVIHIYNPPENLEELRQRALAPRTPAATPGSATPAPAAAPATPAAQPGDVPAVPEPQPDDLPLLDQPTDQPMLDQPTTDQPTDQPVPDTELNDATPAEPAPTDSPDVPETPEQPVIPE